MAGAKDIRRVAIVGGGVIGGGWAARCLAHGLDVVASDPGPGAEEKLGATVANAWPALKRVGLKHAEGQQRYDPRHGQQTQRPTAAQQANIATQP